MRGDKLAANNKMSEFGNVDFGDSFMFRFHEIMHSEM